MFIIEHVHRTQCLHKAVKGLGKGKVIKCEYRKEASYQVSKGLSDSQTASLRAMNIEKEVEIAIFVAASNRHGQRSKGLMERVALRQTGRE